MLLYIRYVDNAVKIVGVYDAVGAVYAGVDDAVVAVDDAVVAVDGDGDLCCSDVWANAGLVWDYDLMRFVASILEGYCCYVLS